MKKLNILLLFVVFTGMLYAGDTLFFKVSLLGLHCANVEVIEDQIDDNVTEIIYHAYTVGGFHNIYKIDNWYYYYADAAMSHLDSLKKDITNRNMKQFYREDISDGMIRYSGSHVLTTPEPVHHILSALVYLQHYPEHIQTGYRFPFLITDEGDLYRTEISVSLNEKKAQKDVTFGFEHVAGKEILEPTDVFNWMICAGKGARTLSYSLEDHRITEGAFSLGWGLNLRAKRVYRDTPKK